ncbi:MAG TPA: nitronate monooxygenase [Phycisphaerae bacterium]|nr:nitronate monooxygenase [Phycisphaerae bacterium]
MGVAVSGWPLARAVSSAGQLGVVSGTGLPVVMARRLQMGDAGGHVRRALAHFPVAGVAARILKRYFVPHGKAAHAPFASASLPQLEDSPAAIELTVAANFVEVFLAKEGHAGVVGINYLEKVQIPHLASLFGAMLAGVDYVLMGAGIPRFIPGVLDAFASGAAARYRIDVEQAVGEEFVTRFDPAKFCAGGAPAMKRPRFLAIISSATLAMTLARKSNGHVDGFIIERDCAGGHNAPPRGPLQLNERGEPVYGVRDVPDLEKIKALGLPFYLAGGYGHAGKLAEARALGAAGIQVGTAFAFCEESGIDAELKQRAVAMSVAGAADVFTDPAASPTGFPLKILRLPGTLSEARNFAARTRICDLGFLRRAYRKADGGVGYRCPAEPVEDYMHKGGAVAETLGRKCLCNALFGNVGLPQSRHSSRELPLITAGDDARRLQEFISEQGQCYSARDVIARLLGPASTRPAA